ncbi:MAG TPA: hypothetical protein VIP98_06190 [Microlunatus sp.]
MLGVNLPYWEVNTIYHVIFTIAVPIAIVNLVFPADRHRPYLGRFGLVVAAFLFVLGVALVRVSVPPLEDPGYQAPPGFIVGAVVVIIVLGLVALRWAPAQLRLDDKRTAVPAPFWLAVVAAVASFVGIGALFPLRALGARQPSFTQGWWVLLPMILVAVLCLIAIRVLSGWRNSILWTDLHTLGLIVGSLVGRMAVGMIVASGMTVEGGPTTVDRLGQAVLLVLPVALGLLAANRIRAREGDADVEDLNRVGRG